MKKAVFFTVDSLLASGIVIVSILLIANFYVAEDESTNVNYASRDLARVLSVMTVGEIDNAYVKNLTAFGVITNTNNTILGQIGEFWADEEMGLAEDFARNITEDFIPKNYGFSVLVNGEEIYSRSNPVDRSLVSSRKIISGIAKAKPTEGFTARVILNGIKSKRASAYSYFGGYEGDGNLTKKLILPNDVISLNSSYIEVNTGGNFNLYINSIFSGSYSKGSGGGGNMLADKWNISNANLANFRAGENTIKINFTSGSSYIGGGFLRVTYITSSYNDTLTPGYEKDYLPGIDGNINLYSSMYVPESITNMVIFLNYSSNYTTFLRIGNTTVYEKNSNGTTINETLSNSTLNSILGFSSLSQKTVPIRLGITNATTLGGLADAVLVSDVSGSMDWCSKVSQLTWNGWFSSSSKGCLYWFGLWLWGYYNFTPNNGYTHYNRTVWNNGTTNICSCRYNTICHNDSRKIDIYINSSKLFVSTLFNNSENRVGLVEFSSSNSDVYANSCTSSTPKTTIYPHGIVRQYNISSNQSQMIAVINSTQGYYGTCICCGINRAVELIQSQNNNKKKFIVLMTDGAATDTCSQQPNSTATADAVQSAWDACNKNITVFTIGFGIDADSAPMQRMNCSGGKYYDASDTSALQQAYSEIAGEINKLSFTGQTINVTGALTRSVLHPNSYIEFNYSVPSSSFNKLPLGFETERFGNNISSGVLTVYENTTVSEARVTSYSETKWTDSLIVNGNSIYRLSDFGNDYQILGDPFAVNIPAGSINTGSNSIAVSTGINSTSSSGGSNDSRVIYTLLLNGFADYSAVVEKSDGCSWAVSFEDGTASTIKVPSSYNGADLCSFLAKTYDSNDALDNAVYQLFNNLDLDKDGKLEVNIDENSLNINTLTVSKIPSLWGPAIIEIRVWE